MDLGSHRMLPGRKQIKACRNRSEPEQMFELEAFLAYMCHKSCEFEASGASNIGAQYLPRLFWWFLTMTTVLV